MFKSIRWVMIGLVAIIGFATPYAGLAAGSVTTFTGKIATGPTQHESVCYGWAFGAGTVQTVTSGTITTSKTDTGVKQVHKISGTFTATGPSANAPYSGTYGGTVVYMDGKKVQSDLRANYKGKDGVARAYRVWGNDANAAGELKPRVACN